MNISDVTLVADDQKPKKAHNRAGYSRGTWEPGSQEILVPQAKYLVDITRFSQNIQRNEFKGGNQISNKIRKELRLK